MVIREENATDKIPSKIMLAVWDLILKRPMITLAMDCNPEIPEIARAR